MPVVCSTCGASLASWDDYCCKLHPCAKPVFTSSPAALNAPGQGQGRVQLPAPEAAKLGDNRLAVATIPGAGKAAEHAMGDEFQCMECGKSVPSRRGLQIHAARVHPPTSAGSQCPACKKKFASIEALRYHAKTHSLGAKKLQAMITIPDEKPLAALPAALPATPGAIRAMIAVLQGELRSHDAALKNHFVPMACYDATGGNSYSRLMDE